MDEVQKYVLANDFNFCEAFAIFYDEKPPLQKNPFQSIGDRVRLITELEKQGFTIVKI